MFYFYDYQRVDLFIIIYLLIMYQLIIVPHVIILSP